MLSPKTWISASRPLSARPLYLGVRVLKLIAVTLLGLLGGVNAMAYSMADLCSAVQFSVAQTLTAETGHLIFEDEVRHLKLFIATSSEVRVGSEIQVNGVLYVCLTRIAVNDHALGADQTVCKPN